MITTSSSTAGTWSVSLDNQAAVTVNGFNPQTSCGSTWSATNLDNKMHSVTVTLTGSADGSSSATGFELDEFL